MPSAVAPPTLDLDSEADDQNLLHQVVGFYEQTLRSAPEAMAYLEHRGLADQALIERFHVGYANRSLGLHLPSKKLKQGMAVRKRLERLGLYRPSGHEHLNGSIVVPVFDLKGRVVQMLGRKIQRNLRRGTPLHLFLHEQPVDGFFNEGDLRSESILLCRSILDCLTLVSLGYEAVAVLGMEFTAGHKNELVEHDVDKVTLVVRNDPEGVKFTNTVLEQLQDTSIELLKMALPLGHDVNDFYVASAEPHEAVAQLVRTAEWLSGTPSKTNPKEGPVPGEPRMDPSEDVVLVFDDRRWRVRGLRKNSAPEVMKINLMVQRDDVGFHVDSLDLYSARHRGHFTKLAALEVGYDEATVKADLGKVLLHLEHLQEENLRRLLEPKAKQVTLTDLEREQALDLLKDPNLITRVQEDFDSIGLVGERTNRLVAYLAATSRKLEHPLAVAVQSSSAAGKSSLMDAVLRFVPEEDRLSFSAMTGQAVYYLGAESLKHKVLAITEEEGASKASYSLKLLQSEGKVNIASTSRDPGTGRMVTQEYEVQGPVMLFLTTTAIDVDPELQNRAIVLSVDEGREQTRAIHEVQRHSETLDGLLKATETRSLVRLHQNAQRLLRPLHVVNPHAPRLGFLDHRTRTRRDHRKYLGLIRAIALLHQYQRKVLIAEVAGETIEYIEATADDVKLANELCHEVLGQSLDEVPPHTRRLLKLIDEFVTEVSAEQGIDRACARFTRRGLRTYAGWGQTQLRVHLQRLVDLEFVLVHRGDRGRSFLYELAWSGEGQDGGSFFLGLKDPYDATWRGSGEQLAGQDRVEIGSRSGG